MSSYAYVSNPTEFVDPLGLFGIAGLDLSELNSVQANTIAWPGKWVTTDINKRGVRNIFQILFKRTETIGDEGRLWGSDGKDFEGTIRDVTQTWTPISACGNEALSEQGLTSVTRMYGEKRVITQHYYEGPDSWNIQGKSWYWQPGLPKVVFEFFGTKN